MFAAPPALATTVWARLPEHLRVRQPRVPWTAKRFPNKPDSFFEGPSFDRDGNLYIVDIPHGRVFRIASDATFTLITEYDGEPNGLKIHRDGTIYIADHRHGILALDAAAGTVRPILTEIANGPMKGPNDLCFSRNGDLYFTDQGSSGLSDATGRLVCLRVDGTVEILLDNVPSPNGLVLNQAETTLFLAVTRDNSVWRVPLAPLGERPSRVGIAIRLSGGHGPDGLAMDEDDGLYVAHPTLGCVWGFDRFGEPTCRIQSCAGRDTTNIAFGGADRRSLFITESHSGSVLRVEMPTPGQPLFSHQ